MNKQEKDLGRVLQNIEPKEVKRLQSQLAKSQKRIKELEKIARENRDAANKQEWQKIQAQEELEEANKVIDKLIKSHFNVEGFEAQVEAISGAREYQKKYNKNV